MPVCTLVEVEYLLRAWPEAFGALLGDFGAGALELLDLPVRSLLRAGELVAPPQRRSSCPHHRPDACAMTTMRIASSFLPVTAA